MSNYETFLESKRAVVASVGFDPEIEINPKLFPFQRAIVRWALRRGRAAIFADCGLGKSPMQLEWARHVYAHAGRPVLILAPLAVAQQTAREGEKFGIQVTVCESSEDVRDGINITNYEKLHRFNPKHFGGIVLDESSILKAFDGKTRKQITDFVEEILYRLACTATPAPNDLIELTNHAEFLDVMSGKEIIALYFTQDGNTTHQWRLKGHARKDFWKWMAEWTVAVRKPSDLGFPDDGFTLPPLNMHQTTVAQREALEGQLFAMEAQTLQERRGARRATLGDRVSECASLVNASAEPWIVWCDLNAESQALAKAIPGSVEVTGSDTAEHKEKSMLGFSRGEFRVLISKPSICGFGMNWQHCNNMAFVGLSDSYEAMYQAIRRCWRFGQTKAVNCHVITADTEGAVVRNIQRKEKQAMEMFENIVREMNGLQLGAQARNEMTYREDAEEGAGWKMYLGDSVKRIREVESDSVGLCVFSPPFPGMYAYTNSPNDMGNARTFDEMIEHFRFLMKDLLRVTMPGRSCVMHITQGIAFKGSDGYAGLKDFRGRIIECMTAEGWIHYGEVTIDKNPQVKAIRTRDSGLQFKSLATDSARMHVAMADYLLQFKKPGENPNPIRAGISEKYGNPGGWITADEWILWARPVWYGDDLHPGLGIRETDVLNVAQARDTDDEKHLCPLQLGVIERCIKLWTAPGETVLSAFGGIGSEGYQAIKFGRKYIGIELKESYWRSAIRNLRHAEESKQSDLFSVPMNFGEVKDVA